MKAKYIIGIDEAGRGPVAGPIAVGAICVAISAVLEHELFAHGIKDSKKLTEKRRNVLFDWIQQNAEITEGVGFADARYIDEHGIVPATQKAMGVAIENVLPKGCKKEEIRVLLDGGLRAPDAFTNQETIIKGDEKELSIALASVMAKVSRDREMVEVSEQFPQYGFEGHKGYGTKAHYDAIYEHGMCTVHRKSFLTRLG